MGDGQIRNGPIGVSGFSEAQFPDENCKTCTASETNPEVIDQYTNERAPKLDEPGGNRNSIFTDLAKTGDAENPNAEARRLRRSFVNDDGTINYDAISEYRSLAFEVNAREAREGVRAMRSLSVRHHYSMGAVGDVSEIYSLLAQELNPANALEEAKELRAFFGNENPFEVRDFMIGAYQAIINRLWLDPGEADEMNEMLEGAAALRSLFEDPDRFVCETAFHTYFLLSSNFDPNIANEEAGILRELFANENYAHRGPAMELYSHLIDKLGPAEALEGARAIRSLDDFSSYEMGRIFTTGNVYDSLVQRLDQNGLIEEAQVQKALFGSGDLDVSGRALDRFRSIAHRLEPAELLAEAESLRALFFDPNHFTGERALMAYQSIADKLGSNELFEAAVVLRSQFGDRFSLRFGTYLSIYESVVEGLDPPAALEEARALRALFNDPDTNIQFDAIDGYLAVVERLDPGGIQDEVVPLRGLIMNSDPQRREFAKRAYKALIERFDPQVALQEAGTIRDLVIGNPDADTSRLLYTFYGSIAQKLDPAGILEEARAARSLFEYTNLEPDLLSDGIAIYSYLAERLDPVEALEGTGALRSLLGSSDYGIHFSVPYIYREVAGSLDHDSTLEEAAILRDIFVSSEEAKFNSMMAYEGLVENFNPDDAIEEARALRVLFNTPEGCGCNTGSLFDAYDLVFKKLDPGDAQQEMQELTAIANDTHSPIQLTVQRILRDLTRDQNIAHDGL